MCIRDSPKRDTTESRSYLPGMITDIYMAYKKSLEINATKIIIVTDIIDNVHPLVLLESVNRGITKTDIFNFTEQIKRDGYWFPYINKERLLSCLDEACTGADKLFFYYTGHLSEDRILLPLHNEHFSYAYTSTVDSMLDIKEINISLLNVTANSCSIIYVLDCCNFDGMELPYYLGISDANIGNTGKNDGLYKLGFSREKLFTNKKVICISSARNIENSVSSKIGSLFSNEFFKLVTKKNLTGDRKLRDWRNVLNSLNENCKKASKRNDNATTIKQTVKIYSSFPNEYLVWRWFVDGSNLNIRLTDGIFYITGRNEKE